jgi:hypothetical protein
MYKNPIAGNYANAPKYGNSCVCVFANTTNILLSRIHPNKNNINLF